MKELSIEEKAKAYDEAIKVAKSNYETIVQMDNDCTFAKEGIVNTFHHIFPELKESENIRIIKAIKYGLDHVFTNNTTVFEVTKEQCLAWLEKQGEHANFRNKIQIGDKVTRNEDGVLVNLSQLKRAAKPAEKQGEQKPVEVRTTGYWNVQDIEQKPADKDKSNLLTVERAIKVSPFMRTGFENEPAKWSEEDEGFLNLLLAVFTNEHPNGIFSTGDISVFKGNCVTSNRIIDWLKSLKGRVQPKQELSEEDKVMLDEIIDFFENGTVKLQHDLSLYASWLKSLRKQSQWKPSDEQMDNK